SNNTKPGNIAKQLGISNAAATDMAKKLATKDLLHYEKYQELKLTDKGTQMALNVVRKHRLWEAFLFKMFDMSLHDIHREAELLEHQTSDLLADKISEYLGNPKFDPHGDPIPNSNGEITTIDTSIALSNTEEGKSYIISRLMSDDKEFFDFCAQHGLKYGNTVLVSKQFSKNKMTQISINNNTILLNEDFTSIIYVNEKI
ncbi:MAG: metal-dependent transcriptional regulator, partial [Flavobacteriaceae bacterium]